MLVAPQIFYSLSAPFIHFHPLVSTFIHFHTLFSTFVHFHPLLSIISTFIHFHPLSPLSSTFMHFIHRIHFHQFSSMFIHLHPLSSICIYFHPFSSIGNICGGLLQMLLLQLKKINLVDFVCKFGIPYAWVGHTCTKQGKKQEKPTQNLIFLPPTTTWLSLVWCVAQQIRPRLKCWATNQAKLS